MTLTRNPSSSTMATSVKQRIAFGEQAEEKVRRIGSGFGYEGEHPEPTGPRCASANGFSLHANTEIPAYRRDQLERLIPDKKASFPVYAGGSERTVWNL